MTLKVCTNKGCGKNFADDDNHVTACEYHSGAPVFHEGLKGWSCCSKKVIDFDEFLKIPGCTTGFHSVEVAAPAPPKDILKEAATSAPAYQDANGLEVYGKAPAPAPEKIIAPTTPNVVDKEPELKEQDLNDPADAVIAPGTTCKRRGCNQQYSDETAKEGMCVFHPGLPVFHEGSKGWSCCSRKVLEFDEFIKIQGCTSGKHRFTDVAKKEKDEFVDCRRDWYQTQTSVIISVFAKKVDKENTTVTFKDEELQLNGKFLDGKKFKFHTALAQPIVPDQSKYDVLSTKVEITLRKANGISWPSIEPRDNIVSWTTFGTTGTVGTIGGKEAIVAADSPIHLLKK